MKKHIKNMALSALISVSSSGCGCFTAGTRIDTPGGPRPIEDLMKGESVWAWDLNVGAKVVRRIQAIHHNLAQVLCRIEVGESLISGVTPEHPFFQADTQKFVALRDLPADARLLRLVDGEPREARLGSLKITEHPKPCVPVFNLAVEGPEHNYFVEGVLVHNKAALPVYVPDTESSVVVSDTIDTNIDVYGDLPHDSEPTSETIETTD